MEIFKSKRFLKYISVVLIYIIYCFFSARNFLNFETRFGDPYLIGPRVYELLAAFIPVLALVFLLPTGLLAMIIFLLSLKVNRLGKYRLIFPKAFIVILLISIPPFILSGFMEGGNLRQAYASGNEINVALEEYRGDTDNYPSNLSELVPKYMNAIPRISIGGVEKEFNYAKTDRPYTSWGNATASDSPSYRLYFFHSFGRIEYHPDMSKWIFHD